MTEKQVFDMRKDLLLSESTPHATLSPAAEVLPRGSDHLATLPPRRWWTEHDVKPEAPPLDMGGWTAVQFSSQQQAKFGVSAGGDVVNEAVHAAALKELARKSSPPRTAPTPWYVAHNVKPEGTPKDMGLWAAVQFTPDQQAKYGVNADGVVVNPAVHAAALKRAVA